MAKGTYQGQEFDLANDSFNNYYYKTGYGGIVPVANQKDYDNLVKSGFKPFQYTGEPSGSSIIDQYVKTGNVVSSTDGIRDDRTAVKNDASKLLNGMTDIDAIMSAQLRNLLGTTAYSETPQGKQFSADLEDMRRKLGITTPEEERQISEAGKAAYARYEPLIREAETAKKQGLPKALVAGGERGGFLNTQMAGVAALTPTEGGTFMGEGGELNRIRSVYDENIANRRSEAEAARLAAEAAARTALRTGKREDYQMAEASFERAQKASQEAIALAGEKANAIAAYANYGQTRAQFSYQVEDRAIKQATDQLSYYASLGVDAIDKNSDQIKTLFTQAGYNPNDLDTMIKAFRAKAEEATLNNLPKPELKEIGGSLYSVTYDKKTGQYITKLILAKPASGSSTATDPEEKRFWSEVDDLKKKLDDNTMEWPEAFEIIKTSYPTLTNEAINAALGGEIPYDYQTKTFDTSKSKGRAK